MDGPKTQQYILYNQRVASTEPYHKILFLILPYDIGAFSRMALSNRTFCDAGNVLCLYCPRH